jgi:hypothetical protein
MLFSRTSSFHTKAPIADIKSRLLGKHMTVHDMDFEVIDQHGHLTIIPHAEHENNVKTLPITHVDLKPNSNDTVVTLRSNMRQIDLGGPLLIVIFCTFMLVAAALFFLFGEQEYLSFTYTLLAISVVIFIVFWTRMETGYFDYIRKIKKQVQKDITS